MGLPQYPFNYNSPYYANDSPQSKEWYKQNWTEFLGNSMIAKYTVDSIGSHIQNTSREQIQAIHETSNMISQVNAEGFMTIGKILALSTEQSASQNTAVINQLNDIARIERENLASSIEIQETLRDMDWRFGLMNEQLSAQKTLLSGIDKLLRIPESQKQRHFHIEFGLKFFKQSKSESEYIEDALNHFLEAEKLLQSDSFVLYHIGIIYLYDAAHVDLDKAIEYFKRAAKYSLIDKDDSTNSISGTERDDYYNNNKFTAKCFYQAAVASFISGELSESLNNISKALKYSPSNNDYLFHKSKLLTLTNELNESTIIASQIIDNDITYLSTILNDISFVKHKEFTDLLQNKSKEFISKVKTAVKEINSVALKGSQFKNEVDSLNDFPDKYVKTLSDYLSLNEVIFKSNYELYFSFQNSLNHKCPQIKSMFLQAEPANLIDAIKMENEQYEILEKKTRKLLSTIRIDVFKSEFEEIDNLLNLNNIKEAVKAYNLSEVLLEKNNLWDKKQKALEKKQLEKLENETFNDFITILEIVWLQFVNSAKSGKEDEKANKMRVVLKESVSNQSPYVKKVVKKLFTQKFNPVQIANYNSQTKRWELNDNWLKLIKKYFKSIKVNKKDEFKHFVNYLMDINGRLQMLETSTNIFGKTKYNDKDFESSSEFMEFLDEY